MGAGGFQSYSLITEVVKVVGGSQKGGKVVKVVGGSQKGAKFAVSFEILGQSTIRSPLQASKGEYHHSFCVSEQES